MDDEWERALEEDRRRMAAGESIEGSARDNRTREEDSNPRGQDAPDYSDYATTLAYDAKEERQPDRSAPSDAESLEAFYANYTLDDDSSSAPSSAPSGPTGGSSSGGALVPVSMPATLWEQFKTKIGRRLYFHEAAEVFFKGFFSPNPTMMMVFVTENCIWWAAADTSALRFCRKIEEITDVVLMGDTGVGIRLKTSHDIYMKMARGRSTFAEVLPKVAQKKNLHFSSRTMSSDYEKGYKKDIKYVKEDEVAWNVDEDPRTGLSLVEIPEKHAPWFTPLLPKILHWFGGTNHITKDWKGGLVQERRACWVTSTSLFLCHPSGPQNDGRDITRCVGIEYLSEVLVGPGGALGLVAKGGPPQPPLVMLFDEISQKEEIVVIMKECYFFRKKADLTIRRVESIDTTIAIEKTKEAEKHRPTLFAMKTKDDLRGLLASKSP